MKTIIVGNVPVALHGRLEASAERNNRSLSQEVLARLERGFAAEEPADSRTHEMWINEAMAGNFKTGSIARLRQIAAKARALAT